MKTTPSASIAIPNGVKSKRENGSSPLSASICAARMFGGVPTSVVVPPRIAPKARGMNNLDGASPARRAMVATAGINTAVAAMLFMKAERTPQVIINTMIRRVSLLPTIA